MAYANEIYEYLVEFTKRSNEYGSRESDKKKKTVRFLNSGNNPLMQVISIKKKEDRIPQIDISQCAAAFMGFHNGICIKIILKSDIYSIYIDKIATLMECAEKLNKILSIHKQDRESTSTEKLNLNHFGEMRLKDKIKNSKLVEIFSPKIILRSKDKNNLKNRKASSDKPSKTMKPFEEMDPTSQCLNISTENDLSTVRLPTWPLILGSLPESIPFSKRNAEKIYTHNYEMTEFKFEPTVAEEQIDISIYNYQMKDVYDDPNIIYLSKLKRESLRQHGVKIYVTKDIVLELSLVDIDEKLWISNIKSEKAKENFCIGDRIVSVNQNPVKEIFQYQQFLKTENQLYLIIQRLPNARLFVFDKKQADKGKIIVKDKKWFFYHPSFTCETQWQICNINQVTTVGISNIEQINNIVESIISQKENLPLIIQPKVFIDKLINKKV